MASSEFIVKLYSNPIIVLIKPQGIQFLRPKTKLLHVFNQQND